MSAGFPYLAGLGSRTGFRFKDSGLCGLRTSSLEVGEFRVSKIHFCGSSHPKP